MILPVITRTNLKRQSKKRKKRMMRKRTPIDIKKKNIF